MHLTAAHYFSFGVLVHLVIVIMLGLRVIMNRPAPGVALAWVLLITLAPCGGAILYLLIGERRIGQQRERGLRALRLDFKSIADAAIREGLTHVDWSGRPEKLRSMDRLGHSLIGMPTVCGSDHGLMSDTQEILAAIASDVDSAKTSVLMEFYIWNAGGAADEVLEALIRAAQRGVECCVLIDALGARPWWKTDQPQRLREAGVHLQQALPVGIFRTFIGRTDLRLHRKIVVVDSHVAWTGSMNMVDPRYFKQDSGVGEWVDAMLRLQGSVVVPLAATMIGDWILETGEPLKELVAQAGLQLTMPQGDADIQVIPSGPGESADTQLQMILAAIYAAETEIVMTTPYFVPDEALLRALRGATARGVTVKLIVPERVDSLVTRYASRSYFDDLLAFGVEILQYRQGLLHTKSICCDGEYAMFGTVNLDMRSFWLNFEVALYFYDQPFATALRELQQSYAGDSDRLDAAAWAKRSFKNRLLENSFRLMSPLL